MEELRPRIRPKAPASLKLNVLEAARQEPARPARTWRMWLSAAAVVLIGIMTFALWPKRSTETPPETVAVVQTDKTVGAGAAAQDMTVLSKATRKQQAQAPARNHQHRRTATAASSAKPRAETVSEAPIAQASSETLIAETPTETPITATPSEEVPAASAQSHTDYELQLIADYEKHRDLVNACLAEELAQVRFTQQRVGQSALQYLQEYRELQQRISEQLHEDIENIAPLQKTIKKV